MRVWIFSPILFKLKGGLLGINIIILYRDEAEYGDMGSHAMLKSLFFLYFIYLFHHVSCNHWFSHVYKQLNLNDSWWQGDDIYTAYGKTTRRQMVRLANKMLQNMTSVMMKLEILVAEIVED